MHHSSSAKLEMPIFFLIGHIVLYKWCVSLDLLYNLILTTKLHCTFPDIVASYLCLLQVRNFWPQYIFIITFILLFMLLEHYYRGNFFTVPVYNDVLGPAGSLTCGIRVSSMFIVDQWVALACHWGSCLFDIYSIPILVIYIGVRTPVTDHVIHNNSVLR